jgi:neutral amino acid transport system permease protein
MNAAVTGIVTGSIVAIGAIGLAMVYNIANVPNFAHGDLLTAGAYLALVVNKPGNVALFDPFSTGSRTVTVAGMAVLFALTAVGVLGGVYALGGMDALRGAWWPVDPAGAVGLAVHLTFAAGVGLVVVLGLPSLFAAMVFATALMAGLTPLLERFVFEKFRRKDASLAMMLVVSLALAFVIRFAVQTIYGGTVRSYTVDPTVAVFGTPINVVTARFLDFYFGAGGAVLQVSDPIAGRTVLTAAFSWLVLAVMAGAGVGAGLVAYRWRRGERAILGPYLLGAIAGVLAFTVVGALLAGRAGVPDAAVYESRIKLSYLRVFIVVLAIVMMGTLHALLRASKLGKAMRATSDNRELAKIRGIDTERVTMGVWIFTGIFAGVRGVTLGYLFGSLSINLGFFLLLPMFAAVILGGISIYGAILGSYVVGLSMELGIFLIPGIGAVYRVPIAFAVLILVLLVKPEGIVGG